MNVIPSTHPLIRTTCLPAIIGQDTERVIKLCREVLNNNSNSLAVAAIQLGFPIRLFVVKNNFDLKEVINPEILQSQGETLFEEGCLSVPGIFHTIKRQEVIVVKYQVQTGNEVVKTLTGLSARIFLHEYDHLLGKLFIDYPDYKQDKRIQHEEPNPS